MRPEAFATYLEDAIQGYARENVAAGRWPESGALERSREDFLSLLPSGVATPGHFLFEVLGRGDGPLVGYVWYALDRRQGACQAFIYDIGILAPHRRQGHARRAIAAVERHAAEQGAATMGLNVFAGNHIAQELYRKLGYLTTNLNMSKPL